jgi:tetratricopeptide (TPR) repeat protein
MKMYMKYIILIIVISACSSQVAVKTENKDNNLSPSDSLILSRKAQDHFIKGNMSEMKGDYAEAILEYQEALQFEDAAGIHYALSKDYIILNKLSKSLTHAKAAVKKAPENVDYNFLLAQIYSMARIIDSASLYYEQVIKLDSSNFQAYYNLGKIYESTKPRKALSIYDKLLERTGPEWNVLVKIADLNERMGNVDETIITVEELIKLDPSNLQLKKLLIESYIKTGRAEMALIYTNEAMELFPEDLELIEYKANALIQLGAWEEGAQEYLKIVNSDDVTFESKIGIATAFLSETTRDTTILPLAKDVLTQIEKDSSNWQTNLFLGEIAVQENNDSLALEYFRKAADGAEWNSQVWQRFAVLLYEAQMTDEILEKLPAVANNFPDNFVLQIVLGLSYSQEGLHDEAEPVLHKAVKLQPDDLNALNAYGFTLNQLNRNSEAITYLEKALALSPDNIPIMGTLGLIYDSMEEFDKSDALYEDALKIDSTNALILNNYAYSLAERGVNLQRALRMSLISNEEVPENSSYLDTLGWIYYKLGRYEEALEKIDEAMIFDDNNATLMDHLADVHYKLGNVEEAISLWQKALDIDDSLEDVKKKLSQAK